MKVGLEFRTEKRN